MEAKALRPRAPSNFPASLFPILQQDKNKGLSTTTIQWISSHKQKKINHLIFLVVQKEIKAAGKFNRARGLNALASVNRVPWFK